jgi:hypothetical protein
VDSEGMEAQLNKETDIQQQTAKNKPLNFIMSLIISYKAMGTDLNFLI